MKLSDSEWEELTDRLNPITVSDDPIEEISLTVKSGGVMAETVLPSSYSNIDFDESVEDIEDMDENEQTLLYDDFGIQLKNKIMDTVESAFTRTPTNASITVSRCIIRENEVQLQCSIIHRIKAEEASIFEELAEACVSNEHLDNVDDLAYGTITQCFHETDDNESFDGWRFDGTLYRYTDTPYEYWKSPSNMEEWVDFAADSDGMKEVVKNRKNHVVHFHPTGYGLKSTNPYIEWYQKVRTISERQFDVSDRVKKVYLSEVSVDKSRIRFKNSVVL